MPTCPSCQRDVPEGTRFCPADGTPIAPASESGEVAFSTVIPEETPPPPEAFPTATPPSDAALPAPQRPAGGTAAYGEGASGGAADACAGAQGLVGQVIDGRYRVDAHLGEGGMGVVYTAEQLKVRRKVALKVMHPFIAFHGEVRARFEREARAASQLTHPSCVSLLDFGTHQGCPYLVMEFVEGRPLSEVVEQGPMAPAEAVDLARHVLGALRHTHAIGIVHRDIKPENIMLCDPARFGATVKVLDFGLAKNTEEGAPGGAALTRAGAVCGTPAYLAPEQIASTAPDPRSDLYSLGVVLFQLLSGRLPFPGADSAEVMRAHIAEAPPRLRSLRPELPPALEAVVARALEKKPDRRFPSAEAFIKALDALPPLAGEARTAAGPGPEGAAARDSRGLGRSLVSAVTSSGRVVTDALGRALGSRSRQLWALAGAGALLLGALLLVVFGGPASGVEEALEADGTVGSGTASGAAAEPGDSAVASGEGRTKPSAAATKGALLLLAGEDEALIELCRKRLARQPRDAQVRVLLAHAYFRKLWFRDAMKEYTRAARIEPEIARDPKIIARAIHALSRSGSARRASALLVYQSGEAALPDLRKAADQHKSARVRGYARACIEQIEERAADSSTSAAAQ